jgi:DNA-binding response OmpR family regulator
MDSRVTLSTEGIALDCDDCMPEKVTKGAFVFDVISNNVTWNGTDLDIRTREFGVLYFLIRNENVVLSEEQIYERVWNQKMMGDKKALKNTIYDLRESLKGTGYVITSEYGKGYIFQKEA